MNNTVKREYPWKKYSFFKLISDYNIEIPIIQRDYVQGRKDKSEIRENFLSALRASLEPDSPKLKLDFIYGSMINTSFQPLDGQQRLSTLFLLHWYAALKEEMDDNVKRVLLKFSYETRISSREFCHALVENRLETSKINTSKISDLIIDSPWFFLSWKKDPTIKAMLHTIDDIQEKFCNVEELWEKLTSDDCPIYFYFILLENIGLTDDLYIKMNARGKQLSPFENFKAAFQKYLEKNKWEFDVLPKATFVFKIDTEWTDFFWKNFKVGDCIDDSLMRFISAIAMIRMALEKSVDRLANIKKSQEDPNSIRAVLFTEEGYHYLYKCFDLYEHKYNDLKLKQLNFTLWRHEPINKDILNQVVNQVAASYSQKILFYAQTEFLLRNETFDINKYSEWMRVIRNIIARGNVEVSGNRPDIIRSPETFDGAVGLVAELSEGCCDIYTYLSSDKKINSSFANAQIIEERIKARLICKDPDYKEIIWRMEDTELLMGRIEFALYCINYDGQIDSIDKNKLRDVSNVINSYFGKDKEITPEFRRAMLTIDNDNNEYTYYNYWWSYWYVGNADKRCLIGKFRELEYCIYHDDCKKYLKKLVNMLTNQTYKEIIDNFTPPANMPNWKKRLIQEPEHLNTNFSNYLAIPPDSSCCYLLKSKRPRELDGNLKIE